MVKFTQLPKNRVVLVECRAYALNIEHDISSRLGLVHFELKIDEPDQKNVPAPVAPAAAKPKA